MANPGAFDFGKSVPGLDFMQQLGSAAIPMQGSAPWLPTVDAQELDKRIGELKAVLFWLEQNTVALKATVQALEVQKLTLATLAGMNLSMAEVARAFAMPKAATSTPQGDSPTAPHAPDSKPSAPGLVDPMQWWGTLSRQFQHMATQATQATQEPATAQASAPAAASTKRQRRTAPKTTSRK